MTTWSQENYMSCGYLQLFQIYRWLFTDHGHTETKFSIAQSDLDQQITQYYQHTDKICRWDSHLLNHTTGSPWLPTEPKNQVSGKIKILILRIQKAFTKGTGIYIHVFPKQYSTGARTPTPAIRQKSRVWPTRTHYKQSTLRIQLPSWHTQLSNMERKDCSYWFFSILLLKGVTTNSYSTAPPHYGQWSAIMSNLEKG